RLDGYEIRTASIMSNITCITTVQGLAAAVQGIEAIRAGNIGVRSLQDWAAASVAPDSPAAGLREGDGAELRQGGGAAIQPRSSVARRPDPSTATPPPSLRSTTPPPAPGSAAAEDGPA
ncbi:MAG: hypothetical protein ACRDPJ_15685, partial [Nocardioidaceae bacterium]